MGLQVFSAGLNFVGTNMSEPPNGPKLDFNWLDIQVYSGAGNGTEHYPAYDMLVRPFVSDTGAQKVRIAGTASGGGGVNYTRVFKFLVKEE